MSELFVNKVWEKYQRCREYHRIVHTKDNIEKAYRFYEGDQWHGIDDNNLPIYNFIKPTVNFKTSMIAMNSMVINYSVIGENKRLSVIAELLNEKAARTWERLKLDSKCWEIIRAAAIAGDSYLYFFDEKHNCQIIEKTDIFFADEQQTDIQKQPYIIIAERRSVDDIIHQARENSISEDEISNIKADSNLEDVVSTEDSKREVKTDGGKCTSLVYLELNENGDLNFCRCTERVIYQPMQTVKDYGCYPIAALVINRQKGTARGKGEVLPLINNQIEVNKILARRTINSKINGIPKMIYAGGKITNPNSLSEAGTAIEVEDGIVEDVKNLVSYLTPPAISGEIVNLNGELMSVTRELAGAGDAALGNIDPTQASGTAIIAVRDQASIPLNEPTAAFSQFVEDIARIWMNTERVYNPDELVTKDGESIRPDELKDLNLTVRIDVSAKNPFSKYARERSLENLFTSGHISFEEYVEALDDDSSVPKSKLQEILSKRAEAVPESEPGTTSNDSGGGSLEELQAEIENMNAAYVSDDLSELSQMVENSQNEYGGDDVV